MRINRTMIKGNKNRGKQNKHNKSNTIWQQSLCGINMTTPTTPNDTLQHPRYSKSRHVTVFTNTAPHQTTAQHNTAQYSTTQRDIACPGTTFDIDIPNYITTQQQPAQHNTPHYTTTTRDGQTNHHNNCVVIQILTHPGVLNEGFWLALLEKMSSDWLI